MADPNPLVGAVGGWWFFSPVLLPSAGTLCVLRVEVAAGLTDPGLLVAEFRVVPGDSTWSGVWLTSAYTIRLRYYGVSGVVELVSDTPIPDPALGHATSGVPRSTFSTAWRFALVFQCSTYDAGTSTYAADGAVALYMNGAATPLLSATAVTIPRRLNGMHLRYSVSPNGDCDRLWARTHAEVLPTTSTGALTGATPADLLWFEDFNGGTYPNWTPVELYVPQGSWVYTPHVWPDAGGGGGWGISIYATGPSNATGEPGVVNHPYAGLWRTTPYPSNGNGGNGGNGGDGGGGTPEPPDVAPSYDLDRRYIRRLRRAPHVANENTRMVYRKFELDLERGIGLATGQGEEPLVMLRLSRDGGHTWGEPQLMSAGRLGAYSQRVMARRLGQARDTVFEVTVSDPVAWSLVQAWLDLEPGTS